MIAAPYNLLFWELLALIMICIGGIDEAERKAKEEERTETSTLLPSKKKHKLRILSTVGRIS